MTSRGTFPWRLALMVLSVTGPLLLEASVPVEITEVAPVRFEQRGGAVFADFGKDCYGTLRIDFPAPPPKSRLTIRLGEKAAPDGSIDRRPGGSVNFLEIPLDVGPERNSYRLQIPETAAHRKSAGSCVKPPSETGEITPFRYAEIEGSPVPLRPEGLRQLFVHAPFDDGAASFQSPDATLNDVWELCRQTMKATTAFGVYIDGERERIPYEADAYINMLSHFAFDPDPRVARETIGFLLRHPTWPPEWSLHMPMLVGEYYMATGDISVAREYYEALKGKLLTNKARGDGLIVTPAIIDWPAGERDGYDDGRRASTDPGRLCGPDVNTVANAFRYHALLQMARLAEELGLKAEEDDWVKQAGKVQESFNRVFIDPRTGLYTDGEGCTHSSLHANMLPLAFGMVPQERVGKVADFVESRGMACSVYGAQYLLEALFLARRSDAAIRLLSSRGKRGWWHMIELGSTMTMEAWDPSVKKNLTWNHAWGSAPANIIARFLLGVRPWDPGYSSILIAPQPGSLPWVSGTVPTPRGPVTLKATNGPTFSLEVSIPKDVTARIILPRRSSGTALLDGHPAKADADEGILILQNVPEGKHLLESK